MSSISSAVQLLTSQSLLPVSAAAAAQKATPAQLASMAVSNAGLQEAETLFASPSTSAGTSLGDYYTSSISSDTTDSASLSNALLQSLTPATATSSAASKTSPTAPPGISLLA